MLRLKILLPLFTLLFSLQLFSQNETGSIAGTFIDSTTKEPIPLATIIIEGTTTGAQTDFNGRYEIKNLKAGSYNVVISVVGYTRVTVSNVKVEAGKVTAVSMQLKPSTAELKEVEISATRITNTESAVLMEMKRIDQVVSGISAQQIGRSLDRDAGQVVRRIPGVLVTDNFINIRGLNQRYNNVMLHDAFAPSMEADIKSFSFDIIPSSQIDRILIFKSPTAENPGEWAGGLVKIYTRAVPDSNFTEATFTTSYRMGSAMENFELFDNGPLAWTGINNNYHTLPKDFPNDLRKLDGDELEAAGKALRNNWTTKKMTAMPDFRFSLIKGTRIKKEKVLIGNVTALNYSNTWSIFDVERSDFNAFDEVANSSSVIYTFNDRQNNRNFRTGIIHNWAFNFNNNKSIIEFKNLFNFNYFSQYIFRTGRDFEFSYNPNNHSFDHVYRGIYSGQIVGKHELTPNKSQIDWVVGYGRSYRNQPDYKRYRSDLDDDNGNTTLYIPVGQAATYFMGRFYSEMKENIGTGSVNYTYNLNSKRLAKGPTLKVGGFWEYKDRSFVARNIGYVRSSTLSDDRLQELLTNGIEFIFRDENISNTNGMRIDEQTNPNDSYEASNNLLAGYVSFNLPISSLLTFKAGVRAENNIQTLTSRTTTGDPVNVNNPILSVLPSASLTFNISENMLVKSAYGQTINRPEFRELAPFGFYDFSFNFTNRGNPNLQTPLLHNFDVRWEYYPSVTEIISVAFFYKHFINPIEVTFIPGAGTGGAKNFTYNNAQTAINQGVEVEFKKYFNGMFASGFLNKLGVGINGSLINSVVELGDDVAIGQSNVRPLQGQAPYLLNAGVYFNNLEKDFQLNIQHNVIGRRILIIGFEGYPDIYEMPRHVLDISFSKRIYKNMMLNGGISDILNMPMLLLQDGNQDGIFDRVNDQIIQTFRPGPIVSLGFRWML